MFPSRVTVSETLIPGLYINEKDAVEREVGAASSVGVTTDGWTSRATKSYITYTVHYVKNFELVTKVLETSEFHMSHTGENLGEELRNILTKWKIAEKIRIITVDNAANMNVACRTAGIGMRMPCLAHTLNLASNRTLEIKLNEWHNVLSKVRSIVQFFHKSTTAAKLLETKQKVCDKPVHRLIMDCKTR